MFRLICTGAATDLYHNESMAQYVFGRLVSEQRYAELLSLPDTFNADLHEWLLKQACQIAPNRP